MKIVRLVCVTSIVLLVLVAGPVTAQEFGTRNPDAPPEVAQFEFLVGRWHADWSGGNGQSGTADWTIAWILDGYALQDTWTFKLSDGSLGLHGTMFRTWDAEKGHWTMVEQTTYNLSFHYMTARKEGETMVMYGDVETPDGKIKSRRVFYSIQPDSFEWRQDISRDGGKTWVEGVSRMSCKRKQ